MVARVLAGFVVQTYPTMIDKHNRNNTSLLTTAYTGMSHFSYSPLTRFLPLFSLFGWR